jgi:Na+/proline symporter
MTSNVLSLKNAFNGAFNLNPDSPWITIGVLVIILLSEWAGGLAAVALTDCVQGAIMIFGALSVIGVLKNQYGGWAALNPEVRVKICHFRDKMFVISFQISRLTQFFASVKRLIFVQTFIKLQVRSSSGDGFRWDF